MVDTGGIRKIECFAEERGSSPPLDAISEWGHGQGGSHHEREAAIDNVRSVEIKADEFVYHGRVIQVLGIVKKHGVEAVGIAVKQK